MTPNEEHAFGQRWLAQEQKWVLQGLRPPLPGKRKPEFVPRPCPEVRRIVSVLRHRGPLDVPALENGLRKKPEQVRELLQRGIGFGLIRRVSTGSYNCFFYEAVESHG